jgi:hypothetical protein
MNPMEIRMVNYYRPWSDHGGSPILEPVDRAGNDLYTDEPEVTYDTRVVLAVDYDKCADLLKRMMPQVGVHSRLAQEVRELLGLTADADSNP